MGSGEVARSDPQEPSVGSRWSHTRSVRRLVDEDRSADIPSEYFAHASQTKLTRSDSASWTETTALLQNNPDLLKTLDVTDLDWTGVDATRQTATAAKLAESPLSSALIVTLVSPICSPTAASSAQKTDEIARRIDLVGHFLQTNAAEDLRYINLLEPPVATTSGDGHLDWTGIPSADQTVYATNCSLISACFT
jgi:hypothetical protein